jgi:hypothetical protein
MNLFYTTLAGVIAAVIASVISHLLVFRKLRREFAEHYRALYFEKQLSAYQKLWTLIRPGSDFPQDSSILSGGSNNCLFNPGNAQMFCDSINDFFYSEMGLFLSKNTRKNIFILRGYLSGILKNIKKDKKRGFIPIDKDDAVHIRKSFGGLIVSIRKDVFLDNLVFNEKDIGLEAESF